MKVLVIQQKMIGDVLMSTVICEQLKKNLPDAEVHYLINTHTLAVVQNNPYVDKIVFFEKEYRDNKLALYVFLKRIKKEKYDVVIDPYGKLESNLVSFFSKANIKITNPKWYTRFIYTHLVSGLKKAESNIGLAIENRLHLLTPIISKATFEQTFPKIYLTGEEIETAKDFLDAGGVDMSKPILMLSILGSGKNKTYPLPYTAKVIDFIAGRIDGTFLFNYIPSQENEAKELYALCSDTTKQKIKLELFSPSLRPFLGLLHYCDALIGNEGGAVNMAKALGVPTFSIYSPWITTLAWHTFKDDTKNIAVHLRDFKPEILKDASRKELKRAAMKLYDLFEPSLFLDQLDDFLATKITPNK